jgi:hypothetical protein
LAIVRHIENGIFYRYHGDDEYTNLHTGIRGKVSEVAAKKYFKINLEATALFSENPLLEDMVGRLKLFLEK